MSRVYRLAAVCFCIAALQGLPAMGETRFTPAGIKVRQQWIVDKTSMALTEAPASSFLDKQEPFAKLWKAWRGDEKIPMVDFSKEIVLVLTGLENSSVTINAALDDKGVLKISTISTQRRSLGMTYVLAIVERNGIKAVGNTPLPAAK